MPFVEAGQNRNFIVSFLDRARHVKPVDQVLGEVVAGFTVAATPLVTAGLNYLVGSPLNQETIGRVMGVQLWVGAAMFFFGLGHALHNSRGGHANETQNEIPTE